MTKSPALVSVLVWVSMIVPRSVGVASALRNQDHPVHAEFVSDHAETRREERLAERHPDLAALGERREFLVGIGFVFGCDRQRETFEFRLAGIAAVRRHDRRVANLELRMH